MGTTVSKNMENQWKDFDGTRLYHKSLQQQEKRKIKRKKNKTKKNKKRRGIFTQRRDTCKFTKNEFFYSYSSKVLSLLLDFSEFKNYLFPGESYDGCFFVLYTKGKKFRQFLSFFDWETYKTSYPIVKIINIKLGFIKTSQPTFTCSKSTIETLEKDVNDVVLLYLLLTLNIFDTFF